MRVPIPFRRLLDEAPVVLVYAVLIVMPILLHGGTFVWLATPLLFARLSLLPPAQWSAVLIACGIANAAANAMFGVGPLLALPVALLSLGEAAGAAWLLRRWLGSSAYFEAPFNVVAFALVAAVLFPAIASLAVVGFVAVLTGEPIWRDGFTRLVAHGLGMIVFAPIFMLAMRGEIRAWLTRATVGNRLEAAALVALVAVITAGVFVQSTMPLLFLPALPIMAATLRLGRTGAAASIALVTLIGSGLTLSGSGPMQLLHADAGQRLLFLQFYLACTTMLVLPVAALLKQKRELLMRLSDSEARYRVITERSSDAILNVSVDGTIRYASPAVTELGGYAPEALVGRKVLELVFADDAKSVADTHRRALSQPADGFTVEYRAMTETGALRWFETSMRAVVDANGQVTGAVSAIRDVTARKATEVRLAAAANTDMLTGLPNRRAFAEALDERLHAVRADGARAALVLFDIDRFKRVNDVHGHPAGDAVLVAFAQTARRALRDGDCLARIGGEEFGLVLAAAGTKEAEAVYERLRRLLSSTPVRLESGVSIQVTVSAGVVTLAAEDDAAGVLRAADAALYRAKADGRDRLVLAA